MKQLKNNVVAIVFTLASLFIVLGLVFGVDVFIGMPLLAGVVLWHLNEKSKLELEKRVRRQERHEKLLTHLKGFYVFTENAKEDKEKFLEEWRLAFLYCSDDVIRSGNAFLDTVAADQKSSSEERGQMVREFVMALRRDIYGETQLTTDDWRNYSSTEMMLKSFSGLMTKQKNDGSTS